MRTFKTTLLALGIAVVVAGLATTSAASIDLSDATASGVSYDWHGDLGVLSITGRPGTTFAAWDAAGNAIGAGTLDEGSVSFLAGNAGTGPGGAVLYVIVDNDIVAVTDPEWDWD